MKHLYLLLFCLTAFSQSKPVAITVTALTATNNEDGRSYKVAYTISNQTGKTIHFILNPESVIPIGAGSLNPSVYYKIYEEEAAINADGIFRGKKITHHFEDEKAAQKFQDSLMKAMDSITPEMLMERNKERIRHNMQELKPFEEKQYETTLNWDKTRYFRNDVMEYYISETAKHYFELHINLMQDELLSRFSPEEKAALLEGKNMVRGWFSSQKAEIDFGE